MTILTSFWALVALALLLIALVAAIISLSISWGFRMGRLTVDQPLPGPLKRMVKVEEMPVSDLFSEAMTGPSRETVKEGLLEPLAPSEEPERVSTTNGLKQ